MRAVWLGEPASSTQLIGAIEHALSTSTRDLILEALRDLDASARRAAAAIHAGDAAAIMTEVTCSDDALDRLGAASNAPIITPQHRALRAWAAAHGATTKPSGAGGGDFSVVIGPAHMPPTPGMISLAL
jgi:phosphomevalonate kinase